MPGHCWIHPDALSDLLSEARRWRTRETGGALLGWREGEVSVVSRVLGPGPVAKHGRRSFEPDPEWQNAEGHRIYRESGRMVAYLGDWHTHPLGALRPSDQDTRTAKLLSEDRAFRTPVPLYAILGRSLRSVVSGWTWRLVVYEWRGDRLVPIRVHHLPASTR